MSEIQEQVKIVVDHLGIDESSLPEAKFIDD